MSGGEADALQGAGTESGTGLQEDPAVSGGPGGEGSGAADRTGLRRRGVRADREGRDRVTRDTYASADYFVCLGTVTHSTHVSIESVKILSGRRILGWWRKWLCE